MRLNKAIAHSGTASRRAADAMIQQGRVTVNGLTATEPGTRVNPADTVAVDGIPIPVGEAGEHVYLVMNKPVQVVSTARDPQGRETVLDLLPPQYRTKRLYPVGRLDYFSEGLLLLTNDGELTLRMTHPRYHLPKTYLVTVRESPSRTMLERIRNGMTLSEGETLAPVGVQLVEGKGHVLEMTLNQGVNRQIRRMCRDLGLTVLKLVRLRTGPVTLGDLATGGVRELTSKELAALRYAVGLL